LQLRRTALAISVLVALLVFFLTLIALLGLVLTGLAALLSGLPAVLTLSGLPTLLALSVLTRLLIFLLHVICHKSIFSLRKRDYPRLRNFNRNLRVSCCKRLQRLGCNVAVRKIRVEEIRNY
jgi:hypothetical protein